MAYCKWAGKHQPIEAEWGFAARGGLIDNNYPWGNEDIDAGNKSEFVARRISKYK